MRFTVTWTRSAQNELADIWARALDRRAVADAANKIDRLLRNSPMIAGQEYGTERRLLVDAGSDLFRAG